MYRLKASVKSSGNAKIPESGKTTGCAACGSTTFQFLFSHHNGWTVRRCLNCSLVQVCPLPPEEEVAALYHEDMEHFEPYIDQLDVHRQYFEKQLQDIERRIRNPESAIQKKQRESGIWNIESAIRDVDVSRLDNRKNELYKSNFQLPTSNLSLLDVGCAMGVLLTLAGERGWDGRGIDISRDAVAYCRSKGLKATAGTIHSLKRQMKTGMFDVVTAYEVIEHERDPLAMVRQMYRVTKKGGMAVITTPNHDSIWRRIMGKHWFGYKHPEHLFFFNPKSLAYIFSKAGFSKIDIHSDAPRPFPLSFAFRRIGDYFPVLKPLFLPIAQALDGMHIRNPFNPFDGVIVIAKK